MSEPRRVLLASPRMQRVAEKIIAAAGGEITLQNIDWLRFPDRFQNTFVQQAEALRNCDVSLLSCMDAPERVFEEWSVMDTVANIGPKAFRIFLPYFPTGTMERIDEEGQVPTASTLADLMSALPPAGPGPIKLYMMDLHALAIRHYFNKHTICVVPKSGMKLLKARLEEEAKRSGKPLAICFPDEGAWKRFKRFFLDEKGEQLFPFIVCRKIRRQGQKPIVTVSEGDPRGYHVVIVDDLIHSGGTTLECKDALFEGGAAEVSASVTHAVMENDGWKRFINVGFTYVWITDSCPETADKVEGIGQYEVFSFANNIARYILTA
ncbi:hypothetical protein KBA73_03035 [Patescibacteria group bacterium]|nr:hypothetical protein [Patescibacteria group bacterium]